MWGLHTNRSFNDSETQWIVRNSPGGVSYQPREGWTDRSIRFNLTFCRSNSADDVHSRWWRSVFENDSPFTTSDTGQSYEGTPEVNVRLLPYQGCSKLICLFLKQETPDLPGNSHLETVAKVGEEGAGEVMS